jgi:hypothetical protein
MDIYLPLIEATLSVNVRKNLSALTPSKCKSNLYSSEYEAHKSICGLFSDLELDGNCKKQTTNIQPRQLTIAIQPPHYRSSLYGFGLFERGAHFYGLAFSADGRYLMVWADNRIDVWGTRNRQAVFKEQ